jgi:hypothetical protein
MKALISPNEKIYLPDGSEAQRVAQVMNNDEIFEIAAPLFWVDCPLECNPNDYCFLDGNIILKNI